MSCWHGQTLVFTHSGDAVPLTAMPMALPLALLLLLLLLRSRRPGSLRSSSRRMQPQQRRHAHQSGMSNNAVAPVHALGLLPWQNGCLKGLRSCLWVVHANGNGWLAAAAGVTVAASGGAVLQTGRSMSGVVRQRTLRRWRMRWRGSSRLMALTRWTQRMPAVVAEHQLPGAVTAGWAMLVWC